MRALAVEFLLGQGGAAVGFGGVEVFFAFLTLGGEGGGCHCLGRGGMNRYLGLVMFGGGVARLVGLKIS